MNNHQPPVRDYLQMLKLHIGWPDRDKHIGKPDEGVFFVDFLLRERAHAAVVRKIRRPWEQQDGAAMLTLADSVEPLIPPEANIQSLAVLKEYAA